MEKPEDIIQFLERLLVIGPGFLDNNGVYKYALSGPDIKQIINILKSNELK